MNVLSMRLAGTLALPRSNVFLAVWSDMGIGMQMENISDRSEKHENDSGLDFEGLEIEGESFSGGKRRWLRWGCFTLWLLTRICARILVQAGLQGNGIRL